MTTAVPSLNAIYNEINKAYFLSNGPVTVWLKGFLAPGKTSNYEINLVTNGVAVLYMSTDATSANKVLTAATNSSKQAIVQLNGGE